MRSYGVGLMMTASRFDYRRLRLLAPALVLTALGGCLAVLVIGSRINGARRWMSSVRNVPASSWPSSRSPSGRPPICPSGRHRERSRSCAPIGLPARRLLPPDLAERISARRSRSSSSAGCASDLGDPGPTLAAGVELQPSRSRRDLVRALSAGAPLQLCRSLEGPRVPGSRRCRR